MTSREDEGDEHDSSRIGQCVVGNKKESCNLLLVLGINRNRLSVVRLTRGVQILSPLAEVLMLPLIDKRGV